MIATTAPAGFLQASWLLLRIHVLRFARQMTAGFRLRKQPSDKRGATAGKARTGWLVGALVAVAVVFGFGALAFQSVSNIREAVGTVAVTLAQDPDSAAWADGTPDMPPEKRTVGRAPREPAPGFTQAPEVLMALAFVALLLVVATMLLAIGNGDLAKPDWDLEWLATLPLPMSTMLSGRILARALLTPVGFSVLWPFLSVAAWASGYRIGAPLLGLVAAVPLMLVAATVQTICDTGLRLRLGASQLRNLQAAMSIVSLVAFWLAISPGVSGGGGLVLGWAVAMPGWLLWLPPGLAIQALTNETAAGAAGAFLLLAGEVLAFVALGIALLRHELRFGIIAGGARESGRARPRKVAAPASTPSTGRRFLTPVQSRELRLLGRDRNFLVQTLVMPVMLIGGQIILNGGSRTLGADASVEWVASIAFGIAAYALMFSAFQTLNAEGHALWILYTVPQPLDRVLREKAILWSAVCLLYPAAIFGYVTATQGLPPLAALQLIAVVLVGIPIFAMIATALGVFACDPLAQTVQRKVKVSYSYLYLLLSSTYVYALFASTIWQRLGLVVLTASLALALWQKARDQLPYLLDPAVSPPARVSISDGLIAALMFFVLQGIVIGIVAFRTRGVVTGYHVLIAFLIAGAITFPVMRLAFWRLKSAGVPRTFGAGWQRSALMGASAGLACGVAGLAYVRFAPLLPLFENAPQTMLMGRDDAWFIAILAVCAAPVFEEFIFRGLIFGGLSRSTGPGAAMLASAAIFAIVHPPFSVIPVFVLGLATALVYGRTGLLIGPMIAHAVYNAIIVGAQFLPGG